MTGPVKPKLVSYINESIAALQDYELTQKNQTAENTISFIDSQLTGIQESLTKHGD